jgi:hypothetical protein
MLTYDVYFSKSTPTTTFALDDLDAASPPAPPAAPPATPQNARELRHAQVEGGRLERLEEENQRNKVDRDRIRQSAAAALTEVRGGAEEDDVCPRMLTYADVR